MKYGLQMYSVRDAAEKDLLGTLEKVAALGYHYAEFAGFFGYSAEAVRDKLLEKYAHFKNVLAQKIAARKPGADGEYLAWLTLTVMDGMLVQSQLKNPALDTDAFIEATARLITEC